MKSALETAAIICLLIGALSALIMAGRDYGWMAIATFLIFGREIKKTNPVFWFMMQIVHTPLFTPSS